MFPLGFSIISRDKKFIACAICKQQRSKAELLSHDGHLVCPECLRLIRDDGIVLPSDPEKSGPA
jgi:late competence protein required for DNA uptake (superfamily II DNA/RNA helicase)